MKLVSAMTMIIFSAGAALADHTAEHKEAQEKLMRQNVQNGCTWLSIIDETVPHGSLENECIPNSALMPGGGPGKDS